MLRLLTGVHLFFSVLAIIAGVYYKFSGKILRIILEILLVLASVGLMLHLIPGFHNLKVLDGIRLGPNSSPYTMYYNFDKALVPFILLIFLKSLFTTDRQLQVKPLYWLALVVSIPVLLMGAVAIGGLKIELHHPEWIFQFLVANIFFVSLSEEAFFEVTFSSVYLLWYIPYWGWLSLRYCLGGCII